MDGSCSSKRTASPATTSVAWEPRAGPTCWESARTTPPAGDAQSILAGRARPLTAQDAAIEAGKQSFARFGCVGCHGLQLQGGVPNPNSQGGEVPSLLHASDD